jgi:iron complex transport system permease protein
VACDLVARTVLAPVQLPVGIVTALVGGPFFLWLLVRQAEARG